MSVRKVVDEASEALLVTRRDIEDRIRRTRDRLQAVDRIGVECAILLNRCEQTRRAVSAP